MDWSGPFKIIIAFTLAVLWFGVIPLFGSPFGGCEVSGFLTFNLGCSSWPEATRGFGFVLIISVIAPQKYRMHYVSLAIMLIVTMLGGTEIIKTDESILATGNYQLFMSYFLNALPLLYGAILAVLVYFILTNLWRKVYA